MSLKNKLRVCDTKFLDAKPERGVTIVEVYLREDIDNLREKLKKRLREWVENFNDDSGSYIECPTLSEDSLDYIIEECFE